MTETPTFSTLLSRVRDGDAAATRELVRTYERELRIVVRSRLRDRRLRRVLDTMDVCQSVLFNFHVRFAAGQYDLSTPEELVRLLAEMARNKVTDLARREYAARRDAGRVVPTPADEVPMQARSDSPSEIATAAELSRLIRVRLPDDIRRISELRREGVGWEAIGEELGAGPEAVRKRFTRCMDQLCNEFRLDSAEDG